MATFLLVRFYVISVVVVCVCVCGGGGSMVGLCGFTLSSLQVIITMTYEMCAVLLYPVCR